MAAIIGALLGLAIVIGIAAGIAAIVWQLWIHVAVAAFHAPPLTFWQTWGAMILLGIISSYFRRAKK